MKKKIFSLMIVLAAFLIAVPVMAADDDLSGVNKRLGELEKKVDALSQTEQTTNQEQAKKIEELTERLQDFDSYLHRQKGLQSLDIGGFKFGLGTTVIFQGLHHANSVLVGDNNVLVPSFSLDITAERELPSIGGDVFLHIESGQSLGVEDDIDVYSNLNRDAYNIVDLRPTELWYQQLLFGQRFAVKLGKLDTTIYFDRNRAANDETTQFLGRMFRNNPAIDFPNNTLGLRLALIPVDWIELSYGLFDSTAEWQNFSRHLFNIGEIRIMPRIAGLGGNYRFILWHNNGHHTDWLDQSHTCRGAYGFALSFDQNVSKNIILFARFGWQNPRYFNPLNVNTDGTPFSLEYAWSGGVSLDGAMWGREDDVIGLGFGQAMPSPDYKAANPGIKALNEFHTELYYNLHIIRNLSVTPDFQAVVNPFGGDSAADKGAIYAGAVRFQIDF